MIFSRSESGALAVDRGDCHNRHFAHDPERVGKAYNKRINGVRIADLAERLEDRLPESAPVERRKKRSKRSPITDLAECFGRCVVNPALVVTAQTAQQGVHCPGITDLSEGLGCGHPDILVSVLDEPGDQLSHGPGIPDVAENIDDELPYIRVRYRENGKQSLQRRPSNLNKGFNRRVPGAGVVLGLQRPDQPGDDTFPSDRHQHLNRGLPHPPVLVCHGAKEQGNCLLTRTAEINGNFPSLFRIAALELIA